jgi:hypothetical protein
MIDACAHERCRISGSNRNHVKAALPQREHERDAKVMVLAPDAEYALGQGTALLAACPRIAAERQLRRVCRVCRGERSLSWRIAAAMVHLT